MQFAVAMSTSPFISATQFGAFIFFGAVTTVGVIWVYFMVPETKGRTLEEMDELFGEVGFAAADAARKERIENEIGLTALLNGETQAHGLTTAEKVGDGSDSDKNANFVEKTS
jgi:hypothetical protein